MEYKVAGIEYWGTKFFIEKCKDFGFSGSYETHTFKITEKIMHNYKELSVWKKSVSLAKDIYDSTKTFPKVEKYGITSQIRRSVVSISSNIAEGAGRYGVKEFRQFTTIAYGS